MKIYYSHIQNQCISILVIILSVFITINVSDAQVQHSHIHVDTVNGVNAGTGRGSSDNPYKTITYALRISERNNVPTPWHVHISPGTYDNAPEKSLAEKEIFPIKLHSGMIIAGTTVAAECIIDAQHMEDSTVPILSGDNTTGVTIRNLTLQNMNRAGEHLGHFGGTGIYAAGGISLLNYNSDEIKTPSNIESCILHNNYEGAVSTNMPLSLTNNTISSNRGFQGAIRSSTSIALTHNTFKDNERGAIIISGNSNADISQNTFTNNDRFAIRIESGGHYNRGNLTGTITENLFSDHTRIAITVSEDVTGDFTHNTFTDNGGGLHVAEEFNGNISHNTFTGNHFDSNSGGFISRAGGAFTARYLNGDVSYNTFSNNSSTHAGGAFFVSYLNGNIQNNVFRQNTTKTRWSYLGGGAFSLEHGEDGSTAHIFNNIFYNNSASTTADAIHGGNHNCILYNNLFYSDAQLDADLTNDFDPSNHATIVVNTEGSRIHNNIFSGAATAIYLAANIDIPITHNLFHNITKNFVNQGGNEFETDLDTLELFMTNAVNNRVGEAVLIDPETQQKSDYRLLDATAVIDAGTNELAPTVDFNGETRPIGDNVDIGPYEYPEDYDALSCKPTPAWDINEDCEINIFDLVLISQDFGAETPADPRSDVNGDGMINILDLVLVASHFGETITAPVQ